MNATEVLEILDGVMYAKTEKHLNDLQRQVLEGVLNRQKYTEIAQKSGRSEGHIKDVGCELLKLLSEIFGEPVNKHNLNSVLERQENSNFSFGERGEVNSSFVHTNGNYIGCINFGSPANPEQIINNKFQKTALSDQQIDKVKKLMKRGLEDVEIAEILEIPLEIVQKIDPVDFGQD